MRFAGKGKAAAKFARFLNRVLTGSLAKLVHAGRGIEVTSNGPQGVTISTLAPIVQRVMLGDKKPSGGTPVFIPGKIVEPGYGGLYASIPSAVAAQDVYFTYAPGWYPKGMVVVCMQDAGRWEVISPPYAGDLEGLPVAEILAGATGAVTVSALPNAETTQVDAMNRWGIDTSSGYVGLTWQAQYQRFVITAMECEEE